MSAEAINTNLLLIYFGQFMETDGMRVTIIVSPPKLKLARHSLVNNYTTNNINIYRRERVTETELKVFYVRHSHSSWAFSYV